MYESQSVPATQTAIFHKLWEELSTDGQVIDRLCRGRIRLQYTSSARLARTDELSAAKQYSGFSATNASTIPF